MVTDNNRGTPKTLNQAIRNGVTNERAVDIEFIETHIRDYMAQKFTIAYSQVTDYDELIRLQKLWASIIK